MSQIVIAECKQEVSSFNPIASSYDDFVVSRGEQFFEYHRGKRDEVGGALTVFSDDSRSRPIPAFSARAITSGGTLTAKSWQRLRNEFLGEVAAAGAVDGAYFALHGAMSAEDESDPEGDLLTESRRLLGDDVPIVVSLDLHGILTDRMLQVADAVVVYHTYPHVDFFETGARAARLLLRMLHDNVQPVTARVKIPALVRGDELITESGAFGICIRRAQQLEASPPGLAAGMLIGNPFTDVPELGTSSVVVTDGDFTVAERAALELAELFWQHHEKMTMPLTGLNDAVTLASQTSGTVVLMDPADATSSGASGDSNAILRELIRARYPGRSLSPLVDPPAAERAFSAGVGATFRVPLGGALDRQRFEPIELDVRVRLLSDGLFRSESFGQRWCAGKTAVLEAARATIVVSSRPVSLYDRSFFYAHGQDPRHFDVVVVKSPHCEPHMYADWCSRLVNVDAPGSTSANLKSLGHTRCPRPIFPLDGEVTFTPRAERF